jgi:serine/threonine protein kinase
LSDSFSGCPADSGINPITRVHRAMEHTPEELLHPLSPATQVGHWRVEALQGQGAYGAVYRAVRVGQEHQGPVALKLALYPWDARFAREAQLLSRLHHPSIPHLLDRGVLRHPSGAEYPFLVMEWVDGTPLYTWAEQQAPSPSRLCQLLAQLARALQALHDAGAVHRDVKGDNVLVRHLDGRAVLIDFGSCHFQGAHRLTWQSLAPATPAYLSAQAQLFHLRSVRNRDAYYPPSAADDLYALGITAFRLVTGQYPPAMDVQRDEEGNWQVISPDPRPLLESHPRVQPLLREWILRLLSDAPEARGTAAQLAEALEAMQNEPVPALPPSSAPATEGAPPNAPLPLGAGERLARPRPMVRGRAWKPWLALAATGVCAVLGWTVRPVQVAPEHVSTCPRQAGSSHLPDAGVAAVGDSSPTGPVTPAKPSSKQQPLAQQSPPEPRPGQIRPDSKGRCPGRLEVPINGGCWVEQTSMPADACLESGYVLLKGKCYTPALQSPRKPVPTSSPAKAR